MTDLENAILKFTDWEQPWKFREFVLTCNLSENDKNLFDDIWTKASDFEIWNDVDLVLGCKTCHKFIKDNYDLVDNAIGSLTRAISYDWK